MKKLIGVILVLVLLLTGCSIALQETPAASSDILFSDTFSDKNGGWDQFQNDTGVTDYANVGYLIFVKRSNVVKWANPKKTFQQNDIRIVVDAKKTDGPDDNAFGVICRYQDPDNFYYFYISSDGYGGIGKKEKGTFSILSSKEGDLVKVDGIKAGTASNHIEADCVGSKLSLFVNDKQILMATDSDFSGGGVGLIARSYDTGGTDIIFNNFYVYQVVKKTPTSKPTAIPGWLTPNYPTPTPTKKS